MGLHDALDVVHLEQERLGAATSPPLPTIEELTERARRHPTASVIEAVWDGDTFRDWFVLLLAVIPDGACPQGRRDEILCEITSGHGSMAELATALGNELSRRLDVPFHFASPHAPDDQASRWQPPQ